MCTFELTLPPGGKQIQNVALSALAFALKTMQPQNVTLLFRNVVNVLLTTGPQEHFGFVGLSRDLNRSPSSCPLSSLGLNSTGSLH